MNRGGKVKRVSKAIVGVLITVLGFSSVARAFTTVIMSSSAPTGTEKLFLANATNYTLANLSANPFAANTYSLTLFGLNPNYSPPTPAPTTLEQALSLGATVYVYGFANGMVYERSVDLGQISKYVVNCSTPSFFGVSSGTWSPAVCYGALTAVYNVIFSLDLSTPTVIPPVKN